MVNVGDRFGRWTVVRLHSVVRYQASTVNKWWCRCECGVERDVHQTSLCTGASRSCGCLQKEVAAADKYEHGLNGDPAAFVWYAMHQRCYNQKHKAYQHYGAKGIRVCERWRDIRYFIADMGPRPKGTTLDRLDASKDYEPGNCRWATGKQQIRHRSNTYMVEYEGEMIALGDFLDMKGVELRVVTGSREHRIYARAYARHRAGWSLEAVVAAAAKEKGASDRSPAPDRHAAP